MIFRLQSIRLETSRRIAPQKKKMARNRESVDVIGDFPMRTEHVNRPVDAFMNENRRSESSAASSAEGCAENIEIIGQWWVFYRQKIGGELWSLG